MKDLFQLDPDVIFLNHGSFGACPRPVFEAYQEWQRRLERQPVEFLVSDLPVHLLNGRQALGRYLNAPADDLVYVPNATFGVNAVARSLDLGRDDEVLATDHEYGACDHVWQFLARQRGFGYSRQPIPLPLASPDEVADQIWAGVTPRTRVIFMSHITSATAQVFPAAEICRRAREAGILTIIDGAHAPGQIPLDLTALDADFYTGNAHKWLCAPKGSAFLYARRDKQALIEPLVVGWGWGDPRHLTFGSDFLDYNQWLGTNDLSAYLAVPAAIEFQESHQWPAVRRRCHGLLTEALRQIEALAGLPSLYLSDSGYHQMAVAPLPPIDDLAAFKKGLYEAYRIEIPLVQWHENQFLRVSLQGYNTSQDIEALLFALQHLLPAGSLKQANQLSRM